MEWTSHAKRLGLAALAAFVTALGLVAQANATTTASFVAHQDDDLLFMNPDIASDVQAGYGVWIVYLTAGDVPFRPGKSYGGYGYADMRIAGVRAAYARAARVANDWQYEELTLGGHPVATNRLVGTNVRLVFTFIHAAACPEDCDGDLKRMWNDATFTASPIEGRPAYTRSSFLAMLRGVLAVAQPDYIRTQDTTATESTDHVDHIYGAKFAATADTLNGATQIQRHEYFDYAIQGFPANWSGYWVDEKTAIWNEYVPHDPELGPGSWQGVMDRQYRRTWFDPGTPWSP
jgi:LmbE family N-acetylglucosaminyl deacetylase